MKVQNTNHYSIRAGRITQGCKRCIKGQKLVLFVTGLCPRNCWYCPLSEEKRQNDVVYANEWKTSRLQDIIKEARLTNAKGAGITGGDPLAKIERTARYIKRLKEHFDNFHIHLYTSLQLLDQKKIEKLNKAGLDELRLHPQIDNKSLWHKIMLLKHFKGKKGIEIPSIPGQEKEIKELIDYSAKTIDFLNLNELEITQTNRKEFKKRALNTTGYISQSIQGSKELAQRLLSYCSKKNLRTHFCTAKLKDAAQMKNRIKKRAKNVATEFDEITIEGMLIRPVIYGPLRRLKNYLEKNNIPFRLDTKNKRVIVDAYILKEYLEAIRKQGFSPAIVEEYPTWDATKVQVDYL
ncbi:MAG: radical SAM protein [Nanoarchaeota archaeon]